MNRKRMPLLLGTVVVLAMTASVAAAQDRFDFGKREYEMNCASCHGVSGKGDGPFGAYLTRSATNLTTLAQQNGGVFPLERVYRVIDGRQDVAGHGTRDMPVWGRDYSVEGARYYLDGHYDPEGYVRGRILALAEYVNRLQVK